MKRIELRLYHSTKSLTSSKCFYIWVWTQIFIEFCNFQTIIVMFMKVYISGIEMSQKIHFWYQILLKMLIFLENGKKKQNYVGKRNCDKLEKIIFEGSVIPEIISFS